MNQLIFDISVWLDDTAWSTAIHESYYLYNWIESTHVITLMLSLGILFLIDLRMLGWALPNVPATRLAERLNTPMLIGFIVMFITGILLFYAVPVRSSQSLWFRIKMVLLVVCAVNAYLFHRRMIQSMSTWENEPRAPSTLRKGAMISLAFWTVIVLCGRFIAYDWYDCEYPQPDLVRALAGCIDGQIRF